MEAYKFGYPRQCKRCESILSGELKLPSPYYNNVTSSKKVMLIGQDPYIHKDPDRVKCVLMLDEENGQLKRWLGGFLGENTFEKIELYATNIVKCPVKRESSASLKRVLSLLKPCFNNCRDYLIDEITKFKPMLVLTFGEPAHKLFIDILGNGKVFEDSMHKAFTGDFTEAKIRDVRFYYSPCLHIRTFRVAETYGCKVRKFKDNLNKQLESSRLSND